MLALEDGDTILLAQQEPFEIWTDHQNLQYFRQPQKVNRRQARWLTELQQYHFKLLHKQARRTRNLTSCRDRQVLTGGEDNKNVHFAFLTRPGGLDRKSGFVCVEPGL